MIAFGEQFKRVRQEKGLTQQQVADGLQIAKQQYQRYEYGQVVPSAAVLVALADYFDVSLDYLVGRGTASNSQIIDVRFGVPVQTDVYKQVEEMAKARNCSTEEMFDRLFDFVVDSQEDAFASLAPEQPEDEN